MIIRRVTLWIALLAIICVAHIGHANAASQKSLQITPLRQFLSADAGKSVSGTLTVANLTDSALTVDLSVKQFSVSNYTYDYQFDPPTHDWLSLSVKTVDLQPRQTRDIAYTVAVPAGSKPGGNYYTLFASTTVTTGGVKSTIQAADLVYLTVNGALSRASHVQSSSMPRISFGRAIPYSLQVVNTGNVHFFAYASGRLHGLFVRPASTAQTHLLMPDKSYTIHGSMVAPILPGIYKATYGYKTDSGEAVTRSHWVVFIPPWFIAVALGALLIAGRFLPRKRHSVPGKDNSQNTQ